MNRASASDTIIEEITIHAPAERVFEAFVQPDQRMQWWGHGQWRMTHAASDLRPGGKWELHVEGAGRKTSARGEYRTIERPRLLIFTWLPDWYENPTESLVRVEFEENAGVTRVRLTHSGLTTEAARAGTAGWPDVLASLQTHVEGRAAATDYAKRLHFDARRRTFLPRSLPWRPRRLAGSRHRLGQRRRGAAFRLRPRRPARDSRGQRTTALQRHVEH